MSFTLEGMRVLEVTTAMAGPYCGMLLADQGAEVIRVEDRERGEELRQSGAVRIGDQSASFLAVNRNKKGISLNLRNPAGRQAFLRLIPTADVVLQNNRPGVMERLGIGEATLRAVNPALIFASISGFGLTGPYRERGGIDLIAQGMSGLMSITGEPRRPPVKCGVPITDLTSAMFLYGGILAAYIHRLKTGEGQSVDTSLLEAGVAYSVWETTEYWATGNIPQPLGSAHRMNAPYQAIQTADGFMNVGGNPSLWKKFALEVLQRPDIFSDDRFVSKKSRLANREALIEKIEQVTTTREMSHWLKECERVGVPAGPINNYEQVFADPQVQARDMVQEYDHPTAGRVKGLGVPVKFSKTPAKQPAQPAPFLGQHTKEILKSAGYADEELVALEREGAIYINPNW